MRRKTIKTPKKSGGSGKTGLIVILVTVVFASVGTAFMIIGYHNEILSFMKTTGIALLVVALVPLCVFIYQLINKRIDS